MADNRKLTQKEIRLHQMQQLARAVAVLAVQMENMAEMHEFVWPAMATEPRMTAPEYARHLAQLLAVAAHRL